MSSFKNLVLKEKRKDAGLRQADMATRIGIARTTYAEYEQGKIQPPIDKIKRICQVLNMQYSELIEVENDTGVQVEDVRFKWRMSDEEKILMIQQLQQKIAVLEDIDQIMLTIDKSHLRQQEKDILMNIIRYINRDYMLSPADLDAKARIERAEKGKRLTSKGMITID